MPELPDSIQATSSPQSAQLPFDAHPLGVKLVRAYQAGLLLFMALLPLSAILYIDQFQDPALAFHNHLFHEIAIGVATLLSAAITLVAGLCYRDSGEPLLRWLTLGLLAFTIMYAPHGLLTRFAVDNPALFLLFGPASRMLLAGLLLIGLLLAQGPVHSPEKRLAMKFWLPWIGLILAATSGIAAVALQPDAPHATWRSVMESCAAVMSLGAVAVMLARPRISPLLWYFVLGFCFFAQSSLSFALAAAWNHQWWLAHGIFAAGFMLISFGVIRAFLTTRKLVAVFTTDEWLEQILEANRRANDALRQLRETNGELERLANTDGLTGIWNRRNFMSTASQELKTLRAKGAPLSAMIIDLDQFKAINDTYGHDAGDRVLVAFAEVLREQLRLSSDPERLRGLDLIGRVGGEEFAAALPDTPIANARCAAERVRQKCESIQITTAEGKNVSVSISVGVAESPTDGRSLSEILRVADNRLYQAKSAGRNQVRAA